MNGVVKQSELFPSRNTARSSKCLANVHDIESYTRKFEKIVAIFRGCFNFFYILGVYVSRSRRPFYPHIPNRSGYIGATLQYSIIISATVRIRKIYPST